MKAYEAAREVQGYINDSFDVLRLQDLLEPVGDTRWKYSDYALSLIDSKKLSKSMANLRYEVADTGDSQAITLRKVIVFGDAEGVLEDPKLTDLLDMDLMFWAEAERKKFERAYEQSAYEQALSYVQVAAATEGDYIEVWRTAAYGRGLMADYDEPPHYIYCEN